MDKKSGPTHMLPTRDPPQAKHLCRLKVKGWKQIFQANGQEKKKTGVAIHISDKIDFQKRP